MNNQMYPGEIIDADYVEVSPTLYGISASFLPQRTNAAIRRVIKKTLVAETSDRCLALLAKTGLEHVAALSMLEQQLSTMAPQSAARCREIVDAYAQQAADTIRRW